MAGDLKPPLPSPYDRLAGPSKDVNKNEDVTTSDVVLSPAPHAIHFDALGSLPAVSRMDDHHVYLVETDIRSFIQKDLDLSRLNKIHEYLWMAGRPLSARPLQRQKMMGCDIFPTDQADLHLLKFSNRLLIKPLPEYMLDYGFWRDHLCSSKELHQSACGFLLSYIWLIRSPYDVNIAHDFNVLPKKVTWAWWKVFVRKFYEDVDMNALDQVNKRYQFGELRLGRINTIYRVRFFRTHFIRGYLYVYNRYGIFFERNFEWLVAAFVYVSVVLSAMQVAMDIPPLSDNDAFMKTSYGFVVFSIATVAFLIVVISLVFAWTYFYNMSAAIGHFRKETRKRQIMAEERNVKDTRPESHVSSQ